MSFKDGLRNIGPYIEQRYISVREHPAAPLRIYNYTAKTQFDRMWDDTTRQCRGLILDADGELVQRPFRKFFNLGEHDADLPQSTPEVWHKYDGSLGVLYWVDDRPAIASRGSFVSQQALKGTALLEEKYRDSWPLLDRSLTYLFEIIYPDNRIVVDYKGAEELRLLSIVRTCDGTELLPDSGLGFPVAEMAAPSVAEMDPWEMAALNEANLEGFVLFWRDEGLRLKVKFEDYLRVHRIVTGLTLKQVWEACRDDNLHVIDAALSAVPGVFKEWLRGAVAGLRAEYDAVLRQCHSDFANVPFGDRKTQAEFIKTTAHPAVLFRMLDDRSPAPLIWDMVRPSRGFETFRKDGE